MMSTTRLAFALSLSLAAAGAIAQDRMTGIEESTDPAKASAVEERARELEAQRQASTQAQPSTRPMTGKKAGHAGKPMAKSRQQGEATSGGAGGSGATGGTSGGGSK